MEWGWKHTDHVQLLLIVKSHSWEGWLLTVSTLSAADASTNSIQVIRNPLNAHYPYLPIITQPAPICPSRNLPHLPSSDHCHSICPYLPIIAQPAPICPASLNLPPSDHRHSTCPYLTIVTQPDPICPSSLNLPPSGHHHSACPLLRCLLNAASSNSCFYYHWVL